MKTALALFSLLLAGTAAVAEESEPVQAADPIVVLLGEAACDMKDAVSLKPIQGLPNHFELRHRKATYTMVPVETSTGAVRLRDLKVGFVWIQIPTKSMLLDTRVGQRVADGCRFPEQEQAEAQQAKAPPTGPGLGIAVVTR